jgi:hypothetical protein
MDSSIPQHSGPQLVSPGSCTRQQWWIATLAGQLLPGQSAEARLWFSADPPTEDPEEGETLVTVYDGLLNSGESLPSGSEVFIQYHTQYRRWYVFAAKCLYT